MSRGSVEHSAKYRLAELRQKTDPVWDRIDLLLLPTTGTIYRIAEIASDPFGLNERLGHYTNFTNLLDLSALTKANDALLAAERALEAPDAGEHVVAVMQRPKLL